MIYMILISFPSSKFGTVIPSGISTMPCHGAHRRENNRYRHLERSHGSLSNVKGVSFIAFHFDFLFYIRLKEFKIN